MQNRTWTLMAALALAAPIWAADPDVTQVQSNGPRTESAAAIPNMLSLQPAPESVYAPPAPPREDQGVNEGGAHFDLTIRYMTDYIYRGLDRSNGTGLIFKPDGTPLDPDVTSPGQFGHADSPNLQVESKLSFDLGKFPHPYVGVFVNVYDSDPTSRFQEVRPYVGVQWAIKPIILEGGNQTYIFPEREEINTSEVYGRITLDDSNLFKTDRPILSPYIYGAYDYDLYNGWYFEAGVKHDFVFEDAGLTLTALADASYVLNQSEFLLTGTNDSGFQHYDVGMTASYSLNQVLHFSRRFGDFNLEGYVYYTDNIADHLNATNQVWGGMGLAFKY